MNNQNMHCCSNLIGLIVMGQPFEKLAWDNTLFSKSKFSYRCFETKKPKVDSTKVKKVF